MTRNTQGRCCSFSFRDQKTAWFAIWESGALQSLQKSLAFFSHCFLYVNALIMRGSPQCCTCSYSVDQREVLLSSFTFSVSWWLCLANKLWSLRISDDNAGSSASYRMQFLFLLNLQHKQNIFSQAVEKLCGIYHLTKSMRTSEHLPFTNTVYPLLTRPKSNRIHLKVKPKWSGLIWLLRM